MEDFVGLLKRTIDAQSNATSELRQRIYERARETVEKKLAASNVAPEIVELQRRIVEKAISEVEELSLEADKSVKLFLEEQESEEDRLKRDLQAASAEPFAAEADHDTPARPEEELAQEPSFLKYAASVAGPEDAVVDDAGVGGAEDEQRDPVSGHRETLRDAIFALPENADTRAMPASVPADEELPAGPSSPADDRLDFVDSAFPFALEALSVDSASREVFSVFEEDRGHAGRPLFDMDVEPEEEESGSSIDEKGVSLGRELLYDDETRPPFEPFDAPETLPSDKRGLQNGGEGLSVPDLLLDAEEPEHIPFYPDPDDAGPDVVKASFAEELSADIKMQQQVMEPTAVVDEAGVAEETEALQQALQAAKGRASSPPAVLEQEFAEVEKPARCAEIGNTIAPLSPAIGERVQKPAVRKSAIPEKNDDFSLVTGIFAQAAIREKKRSGKKRLLAAGGIIIAILCIIAAIVWFLTGFLRKEKLEALNTVLGNSHSENVIKEERRAKVTQRLLPDGQEANPGPAEAQEAPGEGTSKTVASPPMAQTAAEAVFHEASTALLPEITEKGTVKWALLRERAEDGREEAAIRGDVSIPGKDMMLRMTIRRNHDATIPAAYLIELIFVVPENFDGGAVDRIGPLLFKASEQSAGQELQGTVPFRIDDNFFVLAMNAPQPFLNRNLSIMRQLPWMKLDIAYKNGRIGEFSIAKGDAGDAIFKRVLDESAQGENTGAVGKTEPSGIETESSAKP